MKPADGIYVLAWGQKDPTPFVAKWCESMVLSPEVESWEGCVWHDGEDGNPDGDGELHAPPGWFVRSHDNIDGGEYESYWIGDEVACWVPLPTRPLE